METIREKVNTCGKSRYRICKETGIDKAAMSRIMNGGSCMAETADILLKYFHIELVEKRTQGREK